MPACNWLADKLKKVETLVYCDGCDVSYKCVCKGQLTGYEHYPTQRGLPKLVPVYSLGGMCWLDNDRGQLASRKATVAKRDS